LSFRSRLKILIVSLFLPGKNRSTRGQVRFRDPEGVIRRHSIILHRVEERESVFWNPCGLSAGKFTRILTCGTDRNLSATSGFSATTSGSAALPADFPQGVSLISSRWNGWNGSHDAARKNAGLTRRHDVITSRRKGPAASQGIRRLLPAEISPHKSANEGSRKDLTG